uniref:Predicted protein n=1 Tax=Hordeum vulgare subsp. vulgare TaxID=112509 RepID=F2EC54_HORVV|nr:predicted protein [Hordeum vulgare subsp. vulgare]
MKEVRRLFLPPRRVLAFAAPLSLHA